MSQHIIAFSLLLLITNVFSYSRKEERGKEKKLTDYKYMSEKSQQLSTVIYE